MELIYDYLFIVMWIAWGVYWIASARGIKPAVRRESRLSRWAHFGPLIVAGLNEALGSGRVQRLRCVAVGHER